MMQIVITRGSYILQGKQSGVKLTFDCIERLKRFNNYSNGKLIREDLRLYDLFTQNTEETIKSGITMLNKIYGLQRHQVFPPEVSAPILMQYLAEIRRTPMASLDTLKHILQTFDSFRKKLSDNLERDNLLPEVSFSKLLHFINPNSFWIVDSRVKSVLFLWGYESNYHGFTKFLEDLFRDPIFLQFEEFVLRKDIELVNNHHIECYQPYLLKILDKILWISTLA